jgi:hypothetical protein
MKHDLPLTSPSLHPSNGADSPYRAADAENHWSHSAWQPPFNCSARCPQLGPKEGAPRLEVNQGGLKPFPRTGCVPHAETHPSRIQNALASFCAVNVVKILIWRGISPLSSPPFSDTLRYGTQLPRPPSPRHSRYSCASARATLFSPVSPRRPCRSAVRSRSANPELKELSKS